jgi:putative Mg2+ transporter-C (MgtC) family protein
MLAVNPHRRRYGFPLSVGRMQLDTPNPGTPWPGRHGLSALSALCQHPLQVGGAGIVGMSAWAVIVETFADEFSDITELDQAVRIILRLLLAALLGALLGYEREHSGKAAGVRTHMLVALGAALFVLVPQLDGSEEDAMSRVIQGVVAGVGFLCAGTILKNDHINEVKGLTTAAGIWLTAAIGMSVGIGSETTAVLATLLGLFVLNVVPHVVDRLEKKTKE